MKIRKQISYLFGKYWLSGLLITITLIFILCDCWAAHRFPLWYDEYFTQSISQAHDLRQVVAPLYKGQEPNPPLLYLLTHISVTLAGMDPLAVRLPSILAFWGAVAMLYYSIQRIASPWIGLITSSLLVLTPAYTYSMEARPYALVFFFASAAAALWIEVATRPLRQGNCRLAFAIGLCLVGAVSSHYYACLLLPVFSITALAYCLRHKCIRWDIWFAIGIGALALLCYSPWMLRGQQYTAHVWQASAHFYAAPTFSALCASYLEYLPVFAGTLILVVIGLVLSVIGLLWKDRFRRSEKNFSHPVLIDSLVLASSFAFLPLLGLALGKIATGIFMQRYVISEALGGALLFALAMHRLFAGRTELLRILSLVAMTLTLSRAILLASSASTSAAQLNKELRCLDAVPTSARIVVASPFQFVQVWAAAPEKIKQRLVFIHKSSNAVECPEDFADRQISLLCNWVPALPVSNPELFGRYTREWILYSARPAQGWLSKRPELHVESRIAIRSLGAEDLWLMRP